MPRSPPGSTECTLCAEGFYLHDLSKIGEFLGQEDCVRCPDLAKCSAGSTLETLELESNRWRLSTRTIDIRRCPEVGGVEHTSCGGGTVRDWEWGSGDDGGSGDDAGSGDDGGSGSGETVGGSGEARQSADLFTRALYCRRAAHALGRARVLCPA